MQSMGLGFESLTWPNFHPEEGDSSSVGNSRHRNHKVWSHLKEGPGHCLMSIASQCPKNYILQMPDRKKIQIIFWELILIAI